MNSHDRQSQLFPVDVPQYEKGATIEEKFQTFHAANPHVYNAIEHEALVAQRDGYKIGIKAIFEHLRWRWRAATKGDEYKLNNNFTALYARMAMKRHYALKDFFEIRVQTSCR